MKKRVIIWGVGRIFQSMYSMIDLEDVIYLIDNDSNKWGNVLYGKEIFAPDRMTALDFDIIVIFVSKPYDEIYSYLVNTLQVDKSKIRYWSQYYHFYNIMQTAQKLFQDVETGNILDIGNNLIKGKVYSSDICNDNTKVYGCNKGIFSYSSDSNHYPIYINLYSKVFDNYEEALLYNKYEAVFLGSITQFDNIENFECFLKTFLKNFHKIYFIRPYPDEIQNCYWSGVLDIKIGKIREWNLQLNRLVCIEKNELEKEVCIYIAAHKEFSVPQIEGYVPLWLGKSEYNVYGFQEDKEEPSISHLNVLINECTGLYWMWKHTKSDYIGLVHYRRYFINNKLEYDNKKILDLSQIKSILNEYDIILPEYVFFNCSVYEHLKMSIEEQAFIEGYKIVKELVDDKQPEYREAFNYVFEGNAMFPCNMFITRRDIFNQYCEWLFSIIIDAASSINVDNYSAFSKRVIGFFAERLFTVWLVKQPLKIKQLPIWFTENDVETSIKK